MHFSTRTRFAIQMMVVLSVYGSEDNVKIKDISKRQNISVKYLEQIVATLNKAGFVKGERGPQGGYRLGMRPDRITAGMIVRLMEGTQSEGDGETKGSSEPWAARCLDMGLWSRINESVDEILDGTTIADLVDLARSNGLVDSMDSPEYFI